MAYPIEPPVEPMLARRVDAVPRTGDWLFEPKWDGFRTLVFRDGDDLFLQSRDLRSMRRYFPELTAPLLEALPDRAVLDGELILPGPDGLDFVALQMRIHPAASRVATLAARTPASIVLFDALAVGDEDLRGVPFSERRARLEGLLEGAAPPVHLTPATTDVATAEDWFHRFEGAGLDGVMAKDPSGLYTPKQRTMLKVKHARTADCVVAGFRWHKNGPGTDVGSLLLGLYDDGGKLHHVGVAASFKATRRRALAAELEPYRQGAAEGHPWATWADWSSGGQHQRVPGSGSRWSRGKSLAWEPLRPELVVEVKYDHMQGARFRHTTHVVRWRTDKTAAYCAYDQLEATPPAELAHLFNPPGGDP